MWLELGGLKQFRNPGDFLLIGIMKPITNIKSCGLKRQPERSWDAHGPSSTHPASWERQPRRLQVSVAHPGPSFCVMSFVGSRGRRAEDGVSVWVALQGACCTLVLGMMIHGYTKPSSPRLPPSSSLKVLSLEPLASACCGVQAGFGLWESRKI